MPNTTQKEYKHVPFSEEDVCVVSKADPIIIWAGTKIMYSGGINGNASGYNFYSGESDLEPVTESGWGRIRIPELNQLHKIFVFPKNPRLVVRADYIHLNATVGSSGVPNGIGGCSGKYALLHYQTICSGCGTWLSGVLTSGAFNLTYGSGLFDVIAFGSQF